MLRRRPLRENERENDKISTLKTINNALNADIDSSKNIDEIVLAINKYCKATKALPAIKKDYMFTVDCDEYNDGYDYFNNNLKEFINDLIDSLIADCKKGDEQHADDFIYWISSTGRRPLRGNDKISTLKTLKNDLNADIYRSKNIDEIVLAINKYCNAIKALPAIKKDYIFTVDCDEYNDYYDNFKDNLKAFIKDLIDSFIADCKKGDELTADDFIYWISSTGRRPLRENERENDQISTLKTIINNADIDKSRNIDKIVKAINNYCKASNASPAIKTNHEGDYIFTVDYAEYNNYYDNFKDNLKAFIKDLSDSMNDDKKDDKISTLKTINNALNADIDKSKNIDKIVKAINTYCKAIKALPAIKTNHDGDYIFTVDCAEYNHYYDNFKDNLKAFIKDLIDSFIADCKKGDELTADDFIFWINKNVR